MLALLGDARLGRTWFIETAGSTCGYLTLCYGYSLELGGRDGYVDELYIREAWRGRGLGTRALEAACSAARADGVVALYPEVRPTLATIRAQRNTRGKRSSGTSAKFSSESSRRSCRRWEMCRPMHCHSTWDPTC